MAESTPSSTAASAAAPAPAKASPLRKLIPIVFVAIVVVVECVVAYTYLPSSAPTAALAESAPQETPPAKAASEEKDKHAESKHAADKHGGEKHGGEKPVEVSKADLIEVDLGQFTVTSVQPGSSTTLRIAFHLYGTVAGLDHERFTVRLKEAQHRLREQVILAIRGVEMSDLIEPGLGLLKRTILEKTNTTLGEPLLKAIVVSEFSFMEV
jgi:flagellar FliL protein